jgi:hypothetical protein
MGNNIAGENVILGASFVRDKAGFIAHNEEKYAATPVFGADSIPRGRNAHIGDGIWMRRCTSCDDFTLSYGSIAYLHDHAAHEASHLGSVVPGFNSPLLP